MNKLEKQLERHEGFRKLPYEDTVGKLSIGIGRNLDDVGISRDEALVMLRNDIAEAEKGLKQFEWFDRLDPVRKDTLVNMVFNMGLPSFLEFEQTIAYIKAGDYEAASEEMLDSKWAREDVGYRADELSYQMRTGLYHPSIGG